MKLFNLDLHISVIEDIKNILTNLGHELISKSISSHNWVFNREPSKMDIITETSWTQIDQKMCDDFYKRYNIPLDGVYNGKMIMGIIDLIEKNYFPKGSSILAVNTGGLQGNRGLNERFDVQLPTDCK